MSVKAVVIRDTSKAEINKLKNLTDKIEVTSIKSIVDNFLGGIHDIETMIELPRIIITHTILSSERLIECIQVCSKYRGERRLSRDEAEMLIKELKTTLGRVPLVKNKKAEKNLEDLIQLLASDTGYVWVMLELERFLKLRKQHQQSYFSLLYSSIVWIWTLFEITAADLWEQILNTGFDHMGKDALRRFWKKGMTSVEDDIRGKYIRLDYLEKFNYNIRDNVGSILRHYFDFSCLTSMADAYSLALPRSTTMKKALRSETLNILAESRHLIVHKAGIIDGRYKRITGTSQKVGDRLEIDKRHTELYITLVVQVIRQILNSTNQYLKLIT